ncbi:MAG: abortive infection family protein [Chloroflexi bacterium]|nr:abortive infection family protein [Chloroflexota bacterium]
MQGRSSILYALSPTRNNASVAHPNDDLLERDKTMLVINISRTLMHYLEAKFQ